jgi:hypothetical protein
MQYSISLLKRINVFTFHSECCYFNKLSLSVIYMLIFNDTLLKLTVIVTSWETTQPHLLWSVLCAVMLFYKEPLVSRRNSCFSWVYRFVQRAAESVRYFRVMMMMMPMIMMMKTTTMTTCCSQSCP